MAGRLVIGNENFFELSGVVILNDPPAETGFPATRLRDRKDYELYKWDSGAGAGTDFYTVDLGDGTGGTPGALGPDYVAIANQTARTAGATYELQGASDSGFTTSVITKTMRGDEFDRTFLQSFQDAPLAARRFWRIKIDNLGAAFASLQIGEIHLGRGINFPEAVMWMNYDPYAYRVASNESVSQKGVPLRSTTESILRQPMFNTQNVNLTFIEDHTPETGFAWWRENIALQGDFSFYHWLAQDLNTDNIPFMAIWGTVLNRNVATNLRQPRAISGNYDVSFRVTGRGDLGQ